MNAVIGLLVVFCSLLLLESSHQEDLQTFNGARNRRAVAVGQSAVTTEPPEPTEAPEPTEPPRTSRRRSRKNRLGASRNSTAGGRRQRRKNRIGGSTNSTSGSWRRRSRKNGNSTTSRRSRRLTTTEAP